MIHKVDDGWQNFEQLGTQAERIYLCVAAWQDQEEWVVMAFNSVGGREALNVI